MSAARSVVFDVGETLLDETRQWSTWASWLGVPPFTLMVALGAVLAQGRPFTDVFALFDPELNIDAEIERRRARGQAVIISREDLHPDVEPAMRELASAGHRLFLAGTMTSYERAELIALGLPVESVLSHEMLGARNREPAFFAALAARIATALGDVTYVGHRLDTSKVAADRAGVDYVYLPRGPIAALKQGTDADRRATRRVATLTDLPRLLAAAAS